MKGDLTTADWKCPRRYLIRTGRLYKAVPIINAGGADEPTLKIVVNDFILDYTDGAVVFLALVPLPLSHRLLGGWGHFVSMLTARYAISYTVMEFGRGC